MDWKEKAPDQYAMYFKCTSRLVETFKIVFGDQFDYQKNRAIVFQLDQEVPIKELKQCIKATLLYHRVKGDQENHRNITQVDGKIEKIKYLRTPNHCLKLQVLASYIQL